MPMVTTQQSYRAILKKELQRRKYTNPQYSLRAFSRHLGLSPSRLSDVLKGRYGLSKAAAERISQRLCLSSEQASFFCDLVASNHARSKKERLAAHLRVEKQKQTTWITERPIALRDLRNKEVLLFGSADLHVISDFLEKWGLSPYRHPEMDGRAMISISIRSSSFGDIHHNELTVATWTDDIHSLKGCSMVAIEHRCDSPDMIQAKRDEMQISPILSGRIQLAWKNTGKESFVEDENGDFYVKMAHGPIPKSQPIKEPVSHFRYSESIAGQPIKSKVKGVFYLRFRTFNPRSSSFWVAPGSSLDNFLNRVLFRPVVWQFCTSSYDFFGPERSHR